MGMADFENAAPLTEEELEALQAIKVDARNRLAERRRHFGIPDVEFDPADGDVIVFRLPAVEKKSEGGLVLPEFEINNTAQYDSNPVEMRRMVAEGVVVNHGVILEAGALADDWLLTQMIFYGDVVKFGRFAGQEQRGDSYTLRANVKHEDMKDILTIQYRDVRGSFDRHERRYGEKPSIEKKLVVDQKGQWMHAYKPIVKFKPEKKR